MMHCHVYELGGSFDIAYVATGVREKWSNVSGLTVLLNDITFWTEYAMPQCALQRHVILAGFIHSVTMYG